MYLIKIEIKFKLIIILLLIIHCTFLNIFNFTSTGWGLHDKPLPIYIV